MNNLKADDKVKILQTKSIKNIIGKGYMPDLTKQKRHDLAMLSSYQVTYAHDDKHYIVFIRYSKDDDVIDPSEKAEAKIMAKVDGVRLKEKDDNELSDKLKVEIVRKENHLKNVHKKKEAFL